MKHTRQYILYILLTLCAWSCSKESSENPGLFYGNWKTSYGDTIVFAQKNGLNLVTFNGTMNPLMPSRFDHEFGYMNGRLGVMPMNGTANGLYFYESFSWIQEGQSFTIRAGEWFSFVSAAGSIFTFTKIR